MNLIFSFIPAFVLYYFGILIHLRKRTEFTPFRKKALIGIRLFLLFAIQTLILVSLNNEIKPLSIFAITFSNIILIIGLDIPLSVFRISLLLLLSNFILSEKKKYKTVSDIFNSVDRKD